MRKPIICLRGGVEAQALKTCAAIALVLVCALAAGTRAAERNESALRSDVVVRALTLIDVPYRFGGSSPATGFDCSGLVRYVFGATALQALPRRSEEMAKIGQPITRSQLEPGDLVFFNTLARLYSHVAIYVGEGRFLHAPARGGRVRVEALDDRYWQARFNGARRIIGTSDAALVPIFDVPSVRSSPVSPLDESTEIIKP